MDMITRLSILTFSCLVLIWTIVGRSPTWQFPDLWDAQLYAYVGNEWRKGRLPYVEVWENKPPGIFAISLVAFSLSPKGFAALAVLEGVFILGCIGSVYLLLRQWQTSRLAAACGTAAVAITSNLAYYNGVGNHTEIYVLWPATLSMYCFSKAFPTFRGKWVFYAGLFSGIACLFKPPGLAPLFAQCTFLSFLWIASRRFSLLHTVGSIMTNGIGSVVAWIPFGLYFAYYNALPDLINASFLYNIQYGVASQKPLLARILDISQGLYHLSMLCVLAVIGLWIFFIRYTEVLSVFRAQKTSERALFFLPLGILWAIFDFFGALAGGRNYIHYFLCLTPSLASLSALSYFLIVDKAESQELSKTLKFAFSIVMLTPLIISQTDDLKSFWHLMKHGHLPVHDLDFGHNEKTIWQRTNQIADYINQLRKENDTLFSWDYLPWIFSVTEMKSPVFVLDMHYRGDFSSASERFGKEVFTSIKHTPPTFILDVVKHPDIVKREGVLYAEFLQFLENRYNFLHEFLWFDKHIRLYKLTSDG